MVAARLQKIFNNGIIFNSPFFVYGSEGRGTTSDEHGVRTEVKTARTTNGSVRKGELRAPLLRLFGYYVYSVTTFIRPSVTFLTSLLAAAIAALEIDKESDPLGFGNCSQRLKYFKIPIDIFPLNYMC